MPSQVINGVGKAGIRPATSSSSVVVMDTDAQAFLTAAAITATTQINAVNELVLDLKATGIWTKMKALYPMVGGTATSHKFNLKNPSDSDTAFRLSFGGGWTHSSTGALPNGTNGYANTFLTPSVSLSNYNTSLSYYSGTNSLSGNRSEIGAYDNTPRFSYLQIATRGFNANIYRYGAYSYIQNNNSPTGYEVFDSLGFYTTSRISNIETSFKRGNRNSIASSSSFLSNPIIPMYLGAKNAINGIVNEPTDRECRFASIGDGLTDNESYLFYQIVEKYQYALGRNVDSTKSFYYNKNYNDETNRFIFNGGITDTTQQTALNTLVNTLKTANIWTKMKAVYPMVGGTALSHKFNLVNPVDSDAAYRLLFNGGGTHDSNGYQPNGSNAYGDTRLRPNGVLNQNSLHMSYYVRSNIGRPLFQTMGCVDANANYLKIEAWEYQSVSYYDGYMSINNGNNVVRLSNNTSKGLIMGNRQTSTTVKMLQNGIVRTTSNSSTSSTLPTTVLSYVPYIWIGSVYNTPGNPTTYSNLQCAFASIGDGLTDAEATTFYNAVQAFQTTLGRQV